MTRARERRLGCRGLAAAAAVGLALALAIALSAHAIRPVGPDFRISVLGSDGDTTRGLTESTLDLAYNPRRDEYLAVFSGDPAVDDRFDVFGQRVRANGARVGPTFRISNVGAAGATRDAFNPGVAYSSRRNEYVVVFQADELATDNEFEIFARRVSAAGAPLGAADFRVSDVGPDGVAAREAANADIAYSRRHNGYLVVFGGNVLADPNRSEILGRRLGAAGNRLGQDLRISNAEAAGPGRDAQVPSVAYGSRADLYLVVWQGDQLPTPDKREVFGQRISPAGAQLGGDFRISRTGADADTGRSGLLPKVAYGGARNQFLVAFEANPLADPSQEEIFGQRVTALGSLAGGRVRISRSGEGDGFQAQVAYSPTGREYLVAWNAAPGTPSDFEIYGQRLALGGRRLDGNRMISGAGPDADAFFGVPAPRTEASQYLVVFASDEVAPSEFEVFGHRLSAPRCGAKPATITGSSTRDALRGSAGRDRIAGLGGNDVLRGLGRADLLCGGRGRDRLVGGRGPDRLLAGGGRDLCRGGPGRDKQRSC